MFQTNETYSPTTSRLFNHFQSKLSTQRGYPLPPLCDPCPKFHPCRKWILGKPLNNLKHTSCNDTVSMSCISSNNQSWKVSQNQPVASPDVLGPSSPVLSAGVPAEFKSYPSMGHAYCPEASFPYLQGRSAKIRPGNFGNHEADSRSQLMFWDILSWLGPSIRYPLFFLQLVCSQGVWTIFESAEYGRNLDRIW